MTGNSASYDGGGAYGGTLNNCTLTGNSASQGGGVSAWFGGVSPGTLWNCIVYFNTAAYGANYNQYEYGGVLNYCCTTPLPTNGLGNITNEPAFVDTNEWRNLRLQSNSPCINAGNNAHTSSTTDLDGNTRIAGGTVDMGAYEFQTPASQISYAWLQQYGLPTDGSADNGDPDGDTRNNWQEWRCLTDPTNAASVLRLLAPVASSNRVAVTWPSMPGVTYFLERSTDLSASPLFRPLATNLVGQAGVGVMTYWTTNAPGLPPRFYRVSVQY